MLPSHQYLCLPSGLFLSSFLLTFLIFPKHATCSGHVTFLHFITLIILGKDYKILVM